jgi:TrmH family RNA methyltransferase
LALSASDIKRIRSLQQKKFRKQAEEFVVEGVKSVGELLSSEFDLVAVYCAESPDYLSDVDSEKIIHVSPKELERISGLKKPNKLLAIAKIPDASLINWDDRLILFLDGINDPGNLGTIIRTAKWFGINTVICSEDCADVWDRKVVQSTMGALFHINVPYTDLLPAIELGKANGFTIVGATMKGTSLYEQNNTGKLGLVIGSESHGITEKTMLLCDQLITIPNNETTQKVESLNAGIATAIFLSELTRPR